MSWQCIPYTYLQAQGEGFSETSLQETLQSVLSKSKTIPEEFYSKDNLTEFYQYFQFGTTLQPSDQITQIRLSSSQKQEESKRTLSFAEVSRAKTLAQQEKGKGFQAKDHRYGKRCAVSYLKYDQDTHLWKTHRFLLPEAWEPSLLICPKFGTMRNGELLEHTTLAHLIKGTGSGSWQTPTKQDGCGRTYHNQKDGSKRPSLLGQVIQWPTPCKTDYKGSGKTGELRDRLDYAVERGGIKTRQTFPTPCREDYRKRGPNSKQQGVPEVVHKMSYPTPGTTGMSNGTGNCEKANKLHEQGRITDDERKSMRAGNGGQLNPDWVEWLMGWPIGWTSLEPLYSKHFDEWLNANKNNVFPNIQYIPRVVIKTPNRVNRLKAIGNGQVSAVAEVAYNTLLTIINHKD